MPYDKLSDLPDAVKKLPSAAQEGWMKAYNAAHKQYNGDEGKAAAVAWSAVQKMGYVKKGDSWIKAEAGYAKGLGLKPGVIQHPNKPGVTLNITLEQLEEDVKNSNAFLAAGGEIRGTKVHPKTSEEKIDSTLGFYKNFWMDQETQEPFGYFVPLDSEKDKIKNWVETGKLTAVSPGVFHNVITSAGTFKSLIDHVAFTPDPFNLNQNGFIAINAEKFSDAYIFYENKYISHEEGGDVWSMVKALYNRFIRKNDNPEGGDKMDITLEQAKGKIVELEAQHNKDQEEIQSRDKTIEKIQKENDNYKKADETRKENEKKQAQETFTAKVDELIKAEKLQTKNREQLLKDFDTLYEIGKHDRAAELLLSRYEVEKPPSNTLKQNMVVIEKEQYDLNTQEGQDKLIELGETLAKEKHAKNPDAIGPNGQSLTWEYYFEQSMKEVREKYGISRNEE